MSRQEYDDLMEAAAAASDVASTHLGEARDARDLHHSPSLTRESVEEARYWNGVAVRLRRMAKRALPAQPPCDCWCHEHQSKPCSRCAEAPEHQEVNR